MKHSFLPMLIIRDLKKFVNHFLTHFIFSSSRHFKIIWNCIYNLGTCFCSPLCIRSLRFGLSSTMWSRCALTLSSCVIFINDHSCKLLLPLVLGRFVYFCVLYVFARNWSIEYRSSLPGECFLCKPRIIVIVFVNWNYFL